MGQGTGCRLQAGLGESEYSHGGGTQYHPSNRGESMAIKLLYSGTDREETNIHCPREMWAAPPKEFYRKADNRTGC